MDYQIIAKHLVKSGFLENEYGSPEKNFGDITITFVQHPFYHVVMYSKKSADKRTLYVPGEIKLPKICDTEHVLFVIENLLKGVSENKIVMDIYNKLNPDLNSKHHTEQVSKVDVDFEAFELLDEDYFAIDIAIKFARSFLKHPKITPRQVIGLGNALYALERLPMVTDGVCCEFGIVYRVGSKEYAEMRYITFRISESDIEISKGGSVYDKTVRGDSFSEPGWHVELGGYRSINCDLYDIEDTILEYINLGAEITVEDESDITYD